MRAALPLIQHQFSAEIVNVTDGTLGALDDAAETAACSQEAEFSDAAIRDIEEILIGLDSTFTGISPEVARRLWICWVQVSIFSLCMYALIISAISAEITAYMGTGALAAAKQAGDLAARAWEKLHPEDEEGETGEQR
ncbi:hypothetical protein [Streptomyces sp. 5-10]|uniref:hypothetical protein n=1 Tax=Streptomyces sp. 5-10 TaxID=878925 RepID=UPI00168ABAE3|nr:hypothetical protein [Streptomyces sp. 5-10]MBD3011210.1 hypothetical protein [Streptomyces sp. 5-10]